MKLHYLLISLLFLFISACDGNDGKPIIEHQKTVIVYLIADNNISGYIYSNISAFEEGMKTVTTPGSNLVVYWDGLENSVFNAPTLFKYSVDAKGRLSERTILRTYDEQNSASEAVMLQVLTDVRAFCPSDSYGLIYGSHGSGWLPGEKTSSRALGDDFGYSINIPNLANVLLKSSMYYDFILLDVCLMSTVEVAYELRNTTDYLVMSPAEIISIGFPYRYIMNFLFERKDKENALKQAAKKFIDYYDKEAGYRNRWGTMAVVKTNEMAGLAAEVSAVMEGFGENSVGFNISGLQQYGRSGYNNAIFDVEAFIRRFTKNNVPDGFYEQLNKVVVYKDLVKNGTLGSLTIDEDSYSGLGCYIMNASSNASWNSYYKELQWYKAAGIDKVNW